MIIIWENHSAGVQYIGPFPVTFQSTTGVAPPLPVLGIYKILMPGDQVIYWQDNADVQQAGRFAPVFYGATGVAAVTNMIRARAFQRFMFHGMFRRVN